MGAKEFFDFLEMFCGCLMSIGGCLQVIFFSKMKVALLFVDYGEIVECSGVIWIEEESGFKMGNGFVILA